VRVGVFECAAVVLRKMVDGRERERERETQTGTPLQAAAGS
jgi:hypothetical protein